jgi:hypothetical protein
MHRCKCAVAKGTPRPLGFTEHVMCIREREQCADTKACARALFVGGLKQNITFEFNGGGERTGGSKVLSMHVFDL